MSAVRVRNSKQSSMRSNTTTTTTAASSITGSGGASLIVAYNVSSKNVLVIGADAVATSRALFALEADASVTVLAHPSSVITSTLRQRAAAGEIRILERSFRGEEDLQGVSMVFCCESDPVLSRSVGMLCKQRGIPVNVSTSTDLSDFFFLSAYRDQSLQIAVSTNGNGPRIAAKIRKQVSLSVPQRTGLALENLSKLRQRLRAADAASPSSLRTAFVNMVSEAWSIDAVASLSDKDIDALVSAFRLSPESPDLPRIFKGQLRYLNAGEGELELLTHGAFKSLIDAGLVIADNGIAPEILDVVGGDVIVLHRGTISETVLAAAQNAIERGQDVIRLHGPDVDVEAEIDTFASRGLQAKFHPSVVGRPPVSSDLTRPESPATVVEESLDVVKSASYPSIKLPGSIRLVSGDFAVSAVAQALSDISFIYPVLPAGFAKISEQWNSTDSKNGLGRKHVSQVMSTRAGAGAVVHGAAAGGSVTCVLASSLALKEMIPTLHQISSSRLPVVIHAATQVLDRSSFAISPSFADVMATAPSGIGLLGSSSVQECHDLALVAHVAASVTKRPFMHFFDGVRTASETAKITVVDAEVLARISADVRSSAHDAHSEKNPVEAIANVMASVGNHLGRPYSLFDFVGPADAESIVVAVGPAASLIESAVRKHNGAGGRVGLLKVRLVRPWSAHHFLSAIPKTTRRVAVIDQSSQSSSNGHGALFLDVTAAFYNSAWGLLIPQIFSGNFKPGVENFSSAAAIAFLERLESHAGISFGFAIETPAGASTVRETDIHEAVFWDVQSDETAAVSRSVAEFLDAVSGQQSVQLYTVNSNVQIEPSSVTHLRYGAASAVAQSPSLITAADIAVVHNVSLLTQVNVAATVSHGGILLLNRPGPVSSADLEREIPADVRADIEVRKLRLHVIDAARIASDFTLFKGSRLEFTRIVLKAAFLHLAGGVDANSSVAHIRTTIEASEADHNVLRNKIGALQATTNAIIRIDVPSSWGSLPSAAVALPRALQPTISFKKVHQRSEDEEEVAPPRAVKRHAAAWPVMFKEAYGLKKVLRPDIDEKTYVVKVTENKRLTPDSYERNVFHIEMDISGTGLKYDIGEALGVYGHNDPEEVRAFIKYYGLNSTQLVSYQRVGEDGVVKSELRTVEQLLQQVVDLFGKPGKKFYQSLVSHATDLKDRERLGWLGSGDGADDLAVLIEHETPTFADVLHMFPSARPSIEELLAMIPDIKPRHYSISSSMNMHPTSVHLLVVVVDWETKSGKKRTGQCTRYLNSLRPGQTLTVSVKPSVMKLPASHEAPVIMAGLGTGMAPFRAFVEERAYQKSLGKKVGPMVLYFGARHRSEEYLYGEELEVYHADGVLPHLRLAFSRDQKQKVYIQHKIADDAKLLEELILQQGGSFYLCGPTWPVPDVRDALIKSFSNKTSVERAEALLEELKEEERYVLEVY